MNSKQSAPAGQESEGDLSAEMLDQMLADLEQEIEELGRREREVQLGADLSADRVAAGVDGVSFFAVADNDDQPPEAPAPVQEIDDRPESPRRATKLQNRRPRSSDARD